MQMRTHACAAGCVAAVFLFLGAGRAAAQEVIDRVLAVANGEVITLSDVRIARELGRVQARDSADAERAALDELIDRVLVLAEADRFSPPEPAPESVDAGLAAIVTRFGSRLALDAAMGRLGVDVAYVRELVRQDLRLRAYLDQRFTADTPEQEQRLVADWLAGLRGRADVENLYENVSAPASGTGVPGRD